MSVLLSAVAIRRDDAEEVVDVLLSVMRSLGHRVEPVLWPDPAMPHGAPSDVLVGPAIDGWVTLVPHYVVPPEALAVELTRRLGTTASAVSVYEDVLWTHHLVERGAELDRYVNLPDYFGPGEYDDTWTGDPPLVAATVGVDPAELEPYFRQVSPNRARTRWMRPPKAHPTDAYHLLDGWVVTDLWRRMGILWPDPGPGTTRVPLGDAGTDALSRWLRSV
jgi:hypothetical protein